MFFIIKFIIIFIFLIDEVKETNAGKTNFLDAAHLLGPNGNCLIFDAKKSDSYSLQTLDKIFLLKRKEILIFYSETYKFTKIFIVN